MNDLAVWYLCQNFPIVDVLGWRGRFIYEDHFGRLGYRGLVKYPLFGYRSYVGIMDEAEDGLEKAVGIADQTRDPVPVTFFVEVEQL